MKISHYNQLLAVATLLSSLAMFATLWGQYQKVEQLSRAHYESRLLKQTVNHLSTMSQAWLTTQDLLFSGQQTYLADGVNTQAKQLIDTLLAIKNNAHQTPTNETVNRLITAIEHNTQVITAFARIPNITDDARSVNIEKSDVFTTNYVHELQILVDQVTKSSTALERQYSAANSQLNTLTWSLISLYILLVIFLMAWFSKYIVKPLEDITATAQQTNNGKQTINFTQSNAPSEIVTLSKAIEIFTQRITIEKFKAEQERIKAVNANKKISTIMNTIPCTLLLVDEVGHIQDCNPEASKLLLLKQSEIITQNVAKFIPALTTLSGEFDTTVALETMQESLLAPNFKQPHIEFSGRKLTIDGDTYYLLTISDINERKHSQKALSALNQQLINAEKLASIGQLSAGIAHEINNPVGFIQSNLSVLKDYITPLLGYIKLTDKTTQSEKAKSLYAEEDLDYIIEDVEPLITSSLDGTARISEIVKDLGIYTHADGKKPEPICIDTLIEQSLTLVANELKYKVDIVKSLHANQQVMGFPQKLLQVFINMLVNASHAIENTGQISITSNMNNDEITIEFEDNGSGISQSHLKTIFDPFFTTKPVGKGTGLGLHIVRSIIDEHDGHIEVSSRLGKGSKFSIHLPVHQVSTASKAS